MTRRMLVVLAALACACKPDYTVHEQARVLTTEQATFDASMVAVNDRLTLTVLLASTGQGDVTVWDIYTEEDSDNWVVLETWQNADSDDDGNDDILVIDGGSESSPSYAAVEVSFRPSDEEYYRNTLI
ncbi:MAG: hypothetical protein QGG40_21020, partial [Myxococcota bacterium]|nr:hypothetical protein [Myxococcota bacterium]